VDAAVVRLVVVGGHERLPPPRVVPVPVDGRLQAALVEVHAGLPTGERLEPAAVERVAEVVAEAVLDVPDLLLGGPREGDDPLDDLEVRLLLRAADVVRLPGDAVLER